MGSASSPELGALTKSRVQSGWPVPLDSRVIDAKNRLAWKGVNHHWIPQAAAADSFRKR